MTGTRLGLTEPQFAEFCLNMPFWNPTEFHHGDCVGADAEIATFIRLEYPTTRIVCRPCTIIKARAYTEADETHDPVAPLDRNRLIVDSVDMMVAFPGRMVEEQRSGTWYTIRYARKQGVPRAIFWPDGTMTND